MTDIDSLNNMLKHWAKELSSESLVKLFEIGFRTYYENFSFTLLAVEELIRRNDEAAQAKIGNLFHDACEYYDSGHRFWGYTVQDQLIDDYFPQFTSKGLLQVLERADSGELSHSMGDAQDLLFAPAFGGNPDPDTEKELLEIFKEFYDDMLEHLEAQYFVDLVEQISAVASDTARKYLSNLIQETTGAAKINQQLESQDTQVISEILLSIGTDITIDKLDLHEDSIRHAFSDNDLDFSVLKHVMQVLIENSLDPYWRDDLLHSMLQQDPGATREFVHTSLQQGDDTESIKEAYFSDIDSILRRSYKLEQFGVDRPTLRKLLQELSDKSEVELLHKEYTYWLSYLIDQYHCKHDNESLFDEFIEAISQYNMKFKVSADEDDGIVLDMAAQNAAKHSKPENIKAMIKLIPHLEMKDYLAESIATNLIISAIALGDDEIFSVIEAMLPDTLDNDTLTFNLACYWALKNNRDKTLDYARRSLELGKPKHSFMTDEDFATIRKDTEFQELVNQYE